MKQTGFFELDKRYLGLNKLKGGDVLLRLNAAIDWEIFRPTLERLDVKARKSAAGRKPTDRVLMFKVLVLQKMYGLADEGLEYAITDRLSFMRFLGLDLDGAIPDARTVWLFREQIKERNLMDELLAKFEEVLIGMGVKLQSGQMVDASFVPAPVQRNSREENAQIKAGEVPSDWSDKKQAHKDTEARWTKKNGRSYYGYKNHVNADRATKIITKHSVTDASVHDSQEGVALLHEARAENANVWADSAYRSKETEQELKSKAYTSHICEKGARGHPLTQEQKASNTQKAKIRSRVEHVFGAMRAELGGLFVRSIGLARAAVNVALMNLTYNIKRVETLIRTGFFEFDRVGATRANAMA